MYLQVYSKLQNLVLVMEKLTGLHIYHSASFHHSSKQQQQLIKKVILALDSWNTLVYLQSKITKKAIGQKGKRKDSSSMRKQQHVYSITCFTCFLQTKAFRFKDKMQKIQKDKIMVHQKKAVFILARANLLILQINYFLRPGTGRMINSYTATICPHPLLICQETANDFLLLQPDN